MKPILPPAAPTDSTPKAAAPASAIDRRGLLRAGTLLCLLGVQHLAQAQKHSPRMEPLPEPQTGGKRNGAKNGSANGGKDGIVAVRIWPAPEYSRVTIESDEKLQAKHDFAADQPPRLYVDFQNMRMGQELRNIATKVQSEDPNIAGIRIGQHSPTVVRMVIDLKQPVRPEVFTLKPVAPYRHRLVFDLYPLHAVDPMAKLIEERLQTIAQAPGMEASVPEAPPTVVPPAAPPVAPPTSSGADPLGDWINRHNGTTPAPPLPPPQQPPARPVQPPKPAPVPVVPPSPPPRPEPPAPPMTPRVSPRATRRQTDRIYIVALDPGHGGEDPGAIGPARVYEKNVVLAIALQVRERINRTRVGGVPLQAFMTRDRDFFVPLASRVGRARRVQSDLFVSIHADAALNPNARGASVYALSRRGATSTMAGFLAEQENRADSIGGLNIRTADRHVHNTLADMSTSAQIRDSLMLGQYMRAQLGHVTRVRGSKVEQANFAVLRNPDTPSVLVETGFISNPEEERLLASAAHQARLADAITAGIVQYFQQHPPLPRVRRV